MQVLNILFPCTFILSLVIEFVHCYLARDGCDLECKGLVVPIIGLQETLDGVSGTHVLCLSTRTPDLQRHRAPGSPTAGPKRIEITSVVGVQVTEENLGQLLVRDHQRG